MATPYSPLRPRGDTFTALDRAEDRFGEEQDVARGLVRAATSLTAGGLADEALRREVAGQAGWEARRDAALATQQEAAAYAPRVSSLRDANGVGDVVDYLQAAGPGAAVTTLPSLGAALLTRGRWQPAAFAGAAVPSYIQSRGEIAGEQYADPVLSQASAEERDRAATYGGAAMAALDTILPGSLANSALRKPARGFLNQTGRDVATEGLTETAQTGIQQFAHNIIDPTRGYDGWEMLDAGVAGAAGGGGLSAAMRAPSHIANALSDRAQPVQNDAGGPPAVDGGVAPPDDGSGGAAGGLSDGIRDRAQKTKDYVSDTIDRMGEAAKTADTPQDFLRQVFGNNSTEDAAAADLRPDTEDPDVLNAADPAAAMQQRDAQRQERAAIFAAELLNDPATPESVKERVASFGGDFSNPEAQAFVARNLVAQRAGEKLANAVNDLFDLSKDFGGKARDMLDKGMKAAADRIVKKNLQGIDEADIAPLVRLLAQRLGPALAGDAPKLARQLVAAANRLSPDARITEETDRRLRNFSTVADDEVLDLVTELSGSDALRNTIAKIRSIPSAVDDVQQSGGHSFLESMLKQPLEPVVLSQLSEFVDALGLQLGSMSSERKNQVLAALASAFGSKREAQIVVEYYGNMRREALRKDAERGDYGPDTDVEDDLSPGEDSSYQLESTDAVEDPNYEGDGTAASKAEWGALTESDGPKTQYGFRESKSKRPFRKFVGEELSSGRTRREAVRAVVDSRGRENMNYGFVDYADYLAENNITPEQGVEERKRDIERLLKGHLARKDEDRSSSINALRGELELLERAVADHGAKGALNRLYEVTSRAERGDEDLSASDDDLRAMKTKVRPNTQGMTKYQRKVATEKHNRTLLNFVDADGKYLTLSAPSMVATLGSKRGKMGRVVEGSEQKDSDTLKDAVASVIARGYTLVSDLNEVALTPDGPAVFAGRTAERRSLVMNQGGERIAAARVAAERLLNRLEAAIDRAGDPADAGYNSLLKEKTYRVLREIEQNAKAAVDNRTETRRTKEEALERWRENEMSDKRALWASYVDKRTAFDIATDLAQISTDAKYSATSLMRDARYAGENLERSGSTVEDRSGEVARGQENRRLERQRADLNAELNDAIIADDLLLQTRIRARLEQNAKALAELQKRGVKERAQSGAGRLLEEKAPKTRVPDTPPASKPRSSNLRTDAILAANPELLTVLDGYGEPKDPKWSETAIRERVYDAYRKLPTTALKTRLENLRKQYREAMASKNRGAQQEANTLRYIGELINSVIASREASKTRASRADEALAAEYAGRLEEGFSSEAARVVLPSTSPYTAKDQAKSDKANKFIGRGAPGSSTAAYAEAWGDRANTGEYSSDDVVFISVNGNRRGALPPPWAEIKKAMSARATLVTDKPGDRAREFNTGERAVAEFLDTNGYFEESPGTWVRGYDIDNATGEKRYAPLGEQGSPDTRGQDPGTRTPRNAPKSSQGKVVKKSLVGTKAGLDFSNPRVQELLSSVGFWGWQDPELTGWGARNRVQAEYDAFRDHLTLQDVLTAAKMQRETGVKGGDNSDAGYVGLNYLRKKVAENSGAGHGVPAYHKYIREQMVGMPSVMQRAWEEYDGDGFLKEEWDKLSPKEKLAANTRRIEAERADKAYAARMDAAGIPKQFRVRHTSTGMDTVGNYRGPEYLFYTEETADGVELEASRYFDPPDADDEGDVRDFTPEEINLGTHPDMDAAEIAASKFLMSKAKQAPRDTQGKVVKKSFVGAKADPRGAEDAEKLLGIGTPADVVWRDLGWFRGPDGKLRKEIRSPVLRRRVREFATAIAAGTAKPTTIGALLEGIDAFKPYLTELGDLRVDPYDGMVELMGAVGAYIGEDGFSDRGIGISRVNAELAVRADAVPDDEGTALLREIVGNLNPPELADTGLSFVDPMDIIAELEARHPMPDVNERVAEYLTGTILHELQHAFQHAEGFENGGNATTAVIAKYGDVDGYLAAVRDGDEDAVERITEQAFSQLRAEVGPDGDTEVAAHELYESIVGEVEANDVAARMNLSDEEAASLKPALMNAKREFVRSVLLAEVLSTVRSRVGSSKMGGRPGRPGKNWGDKDAVRAEILRLRGKDVKVAVEKLVKKLGGSGQYTYDPETGERLIEVAVNASNPLGTARHEAMHDFFRFLGQTDALRSVAKDILDATSAPHVIRQLRDLLKDYPAALEQLSDPEERAAYAYQFWAEDLLQMRNRGNGFFETIRQFLKDLFGVVTTAQRGEDLLRAFHEGKFANPSVVQEVLFDINAKNGDLMRNKLSRATPALTKATRAVLSAAPERLRRFQNDAINELADKFDSESGGLGYIQKRFQQQGIWENKLDEILRGSTAVERREAIDQLQARKPQSDLAKALSRFNKDMYKYMFDAGVKSWDHEQETYVPLREVKDYFTRSWDPDAISRNRAEFEDLLVSEGGLSRSAASGVAHTLIQGSEAHPAPQENIDLGYLPYAPHTSERILTFINADNSEKFAKFQHKDLADIMTRYVRSAVHRAEYAREFGNSGEEIVSLVTQSGITDGNELKEISNAVQAMEGSLDPGHWSPKTKELMSTLQTVQNVVLLPLSLAAQMIDPIVLAARTGSIKDAGRAYMTALKRLKNTITKSDSKVDGEELAEILGVVSADSTLQAMAMSYGATRISKKMENVNRIFFRYNGMQGWNNSMRIAATAAGEKYLIANRNNKAALAELGLTSADIKQKNGKLVVTNPKVQQAMFKFVDQAVLRPSAANRPVWMSDPRFLLVAHLKQFTFAMHNVVLRRANRELSNDNMKPWGILALTMPVILAADMAKFALTGRLPSSWGFMDYVAHSVERSGLLGTFDFGVQATSGVKYGKAPGEALLGPTAEHVMEILRWVSGDPRTGFDDVVDRTIPGARFI